MDDPNEVYRRGDWIAMQHVLTDGSKTYAVVNETDIEIEVIHQQAAIRLVNCLAETAA